MNEELQLPPDRDLPEPEQMLGSILDAPITATPITDTERARPARMVQIFAVAASIAVVVGIAVWAAQGEASDLADPPVVAPPVTASSPASAPSSPAITPTPPGIPQTPSTTPTHSAAGRGTTSATSAPRSAATNRSSAAPAPRSRPGQSTTGETSRARAKPSAPAPTRGNSARRTGTTAPAELPIPTTSAPPQTGSKVTSTITVRRVEERESGTKAYLYLQLRLCATGHDGWVNRARLDGNSPTLATEENSATLSTMAPLWSGRQLNIPAGQCLNRTTLWLLPSTAAANGGHTLTMNSSNGTVQIRG